MKNGTKIPMPEEVKAAARKLGLDVYGVAPATINETNQNRLKEFIQQELHGEMDWMAIHLWRRLEPQNMWEKARTALVVGLNYAPTFSPLDQLQDPLLGVVSVYALGEDYHDILKPRLKQLAQVIQKNSPGINVKIFVDTAPLMEKPLAQNAGIGWQGKHTNLVSRTYGSWLFLGVILMDQDWETSRPEKDHCGSCCACLDVCPTQAIVEPYKLDARRCIAYLTIEHKTHIPREFRVAIGNRIFGCDDCLAVCPWNKFAQASRHARLQANENRIGRSLAELALLNEEGFRQLFRKSPVKRLGWIRFLRNVLIALGNSGLKNLADIALKHIFHDDARVRVAAVWALFRLAPDTFAIHHKAACEWETDPDVLEEWRINLTEIQHGRSQS